MSSQYSHWHILSLVNLWNNHTSPDCDERFRRQMNNPNSTIPDLKYRQFMLQLSDQLTSQDIEKLKYMLTLRIPAGIMESLNTTLKLFLHLERLQFVGPNKLWELAELFRTIRSQRLCDIVTNFMQDNDNRITEIPRSLWVTNNRKKPQRAQYILKTQVYPDSISMCCAGVFFSSYKRMEV